MNKTYRECAIDYIKNRHLCKGYVDYIVAQLNKLDKIEKIVNDWKESLERDIEMYDTLEEITKVLEQE